MTTAQAIETSVTVNNNSPIQEYVHLDDQTQPTLKMTPGFKPFNDNHIVKKLTAEVERKCRKKRVNFADITKPVNHRDLQRFKPSRKL